MSGALVQATNVTANVNGTVITNEAGNYKIANLIPGPYVVSAKKRIQKDSRSRCVHLQQLRGQKQAADVHL